MHVGANTFCLISNWKIFNQIVKSIQFKIEFGNIYTSTARNMCVWGIDARLKRLYKYVHNIRTHSHAHAHSFVYTNNSDAKQSDQKTKILNVNVECNAKPI